MHGLRVTCSLRVITDLLQSGQRSNSTPKGCLPLKRDLFSRKQIDELPQHDVGESLRKFAGRPH
jgi:hypothetical protein